MLVCAFLCAFCTRDRGCSAHPVFPVPYVRRGRDVQGKTRAECAARSRRHVLDNVIARSEATKQSILPRKERMDCFRLRSLSYGGHVASLAMTPYQNISARTKMPAIARRHFLLDYVATSALCHQPPNTPFPRGKGFVRRDSG